MTSSDGAPPKRQLYGLDKEIQEKLEAKQDPRMEANLLDWIQTMTGKKLPTRNFYQALKSGHVLCELANAIRPNIIPKINTKPINDSIALMERDNIKLYLQACATLGIPSGSMFLEVDLHEGRFLPAVAQNLLAMQTRAEQEKKYREHIAARQARKLKGVQLEWPIEKFLDALAAREKTFTLKDCAVEIQELRSNRVRTVSHLLRLYRRKEYWETMLSGSAKKRQIEDALFDLDLDSPTDVSAPPSVIGPQTPTSSPKVARKNTGPSSPAAAASSSSSGRAASEANVSDTHPLLGAEEVKEEESCCSCTIC